MTKTEKVQTYCFKVALELFR